jgi:hypothetical protein
MGLKQEEGVDVREVSLIRMIVDDGKGDDVPSVTWKTATGDLGCAIIEKIILM